PGTRRSARRPRRATTRAPTPTRPSASLATGVSTAACTRTSAREPHAPKLAPSPSTNRYMILGVALGEEGFARRRSRVSRVQVAMPQPSSAASSSSVREPGRTFSSARSDFSITLLDPLERGVVVGCVVDVAGRVALHEPALAVEGGRRRILLTVVLLVAS